MCACAQLLYYPRRNRKCDQDSVYYVHMKKKTEKSRKSLLEWSCLWCGIECLFRKLIGKLYYIPNMWSVFGICRFVCVEMMSAMMTMKIMCFMKVMRKCMLTEAVLDGISRRSIMNSHESFSVVFKWIYVFVGLRRISQHIGGYSSASYCNTFTHSNWVWTTNNHRRECSLIWASDA